MADDTQPSVISGAFRRPFKEQVVFFRNKLKNPVPTTRWDDITKEQHDVSFMVAGAQKADLLKDLGNAIDKGIANGASLAQFRKDFAEAVAKHNWHGWTGEGTKAGEAWRTRIIYGTNLGTSYAAGRYAYLKEAGFDTWVYHHADGVAHPRPWHLAWNGLALPQDDPFWDAHYPPQGWHCHCFVTGARSTRGVIRQGGDPDKKRPANWDQIDPKTGEPIGIDKGWGYAPGKSVASTVSALSQKLTTWPAPLGAAFWQKGMTTAGKKAQQGSWKPFLEAAIANRGDPKGNVFAVGAISIDVLAAIRRERPDLVPATAVIAIQDDDISHMMRDKKFQRMATDWLLNLPAHLEQPDAVVLDLARPGKPDLLYLWNTEPGVKLILKLDYKIKKVGTMNLLRTGRQLDDEAIKSIRGLIKGGKYKLLQGSL